MVDFNQLSFTKGVVLSAFFDSEGNHYEDVCDTSASVINAVKVLSENKWRLHDGHQVGYLVKHCICSDAISDNRVPPMVLFSQCLEEMGFKISFKGKNANGEPCYMAELQEGLEMTERQDRDYYDFTSDYACSNYTCFASARDKNDD